LLARAKKIGQRVVQTLEGWKQRYARVGDVRGLGPMQGIEFVKNRETREPDPEAA